MKEKVFQKAGAGKKTGPAFLIIGKLGKSHGVYGEIEMQVFTDFPERLKPGRKFYLGEEKKVYTLDTIRPKNKNLLLSFIGIDSPEAARQLTNLFVYAKTSEVPPLPQGQYYHHEIIGLKVYEDSTFLGEISEILETGANDVFVVNNPSGAEILLPDIPSVILEIDLDRAKMQVRVPEGLRDE